MSLINLLKQLHSSCNDEKADDNSNNEYDKR